MALAHEADEFTDALASVVDHIRQRFLLLDDLPVIPEPADLTDALSTLPKLLEKKGMGTQAAMSYLLQNIAPGMWQGHAGPSMYGFVIGGVTPAAQLADIICGSYDEQVQVSLPQATIAPALEQVTCELVLDLLGISRSTFAGKTITTGATASNVLGLTCARDALFLSSPNLPKGYYIAENGFPPHILTANGNVPPLTVITVKPHGSILKAAAITGMGRSNVVDCSLELEERRNPWGLAFDLERLEAMLVESRKIGSGVIIVVTLGEVNTGGFTPDIQRISQLCKRHEAWLHIDAAFGGFAALLTEYAHLRDEMALADSLCLDAHKWLNAPYDTALFFTRRAEDLRRSFGPSSTSTGPAYLTPSGLPAEYLAGLTPEQAELRARQASLESPLNRGIENSRRFRALPLFAALLENGQDGYKEIVQRNVDFAQRIAMWMKSDPSFEVLNLSPITDQPVEEPLRHGTIPLNVVLFRGTLNSEFSPEDSTAAARMVQAINVTREIFVSVTSWKGRGAVRIAVSNWRTARHGDEHGHYDRVVRVLSRITGR